MSRMKQFDGRVRSKKLDPVLERIDSATCGAMTTRRSYEQGWFLNQLFYQGFQWNYVDRITGDVTAIPQDVKFRANLILPAIQTKVAKLTSSQPDWDVESDVENQGIQNARWVSERLLEWVWDDQEMPYKSRELVTGLMVQGTQHAYIFFDPDDGDKITPEAVFQDGMFMSPEDAVEEFGSEKDLQKWLNGELDLREGRLKIELVDSFDFHVDPSAIDEDSAQWMLLSKIRSIQEVENRFPELKGKISPEDLSKSTSPYYRHRTSRLVNPNVSVGTGTKMAIEDGVVLNEYWERPSKEFPKGLFVIYANDKILHKGPNPNAGLFCELPFVRFRDIIINNRYWGGCTTDHAINIQLDYNKAWADLIKNRHDHGANKWLVPRGAGLLPGAIDRSSDEIIEYNAVSLGTGAPLMPQRVAPGVATNLHFESMERARDAINTLYGVHEASQGRAPTGITAMGAIQLLQQADDQRTGPVLQELYRGYSRLGRMALELLKQNIEGHRSFRAVSGTAEGEWIDFESEDLSAKSVRVKMGSLMGRSRTAKQQGMTAIMQYFPELLQGADMKAAALQAFGLRGGAVDPSAADRNRAIYENKQMERGIVPRVEDYDDDATHLAIIEQRMKQLDYDRLPPQVQEIFRAHRQAHLSAMSEASQAALEAEAVAAQAKQGGRGQPQSKVGIGIGISGEDYAALQGQLPGQGLPEE